MRSQYITREELTALRKYLCETDRDVLDIGTATGLRITDIITLRRENLQGDERIKRFCIVQTAHKTGKTGVWWIPERLYRRLKSRRGWLIPGRGKNHRTRQAVWQGIKRAAERAEEDPHGKSPHSYRKIYAVTTRQTEGIQAAQRGLQHSNRDLTRLYAYADHFTREAADEPIRWKDVGIIVDYILERIREQDLDTGKNP